MFNLDFKKKIMIAVALLGALLILIFQRGLYSQDSQSSKPQQTQDKEIQDEETDEEIKIISTNPSPLDNTIILPTQTVEITFNYPLQNIGEFKNKIDPKADYKVKLSDDRKTVKISPAKNWGLGTTYTLFILPDTKFDDKGNLNKDFIYHFRTIEYKGI